MKGTGSLTDGFIVCMGFNSTPGFAKHVSLGNTKLIGSIVHPSRSVKCFHVDKHSHIFKNILVIRLHSPCRLPHVPSMGSPQAPCIMGEKNNNEKSQIMNQMITIYLIHFYIFKGTNASKDLENGRD